MLDNTLYKPVEYNGCKCLVSRNGEVFTIGKGEKFVRREWRYNADGYPVVSAVGYCGKKKIYRSLQVHILVALAWVPNPENKPEVNHKDFNRQNPVYSNLEWVTHEENIRYSKNANRYPSHFGKDNPNFGNKKLSEKYAKDKLLSKEKQSRPGGKNGRAKTCIMFDKEDNAFGPYACQRDAIEELIRIGIVAFTQNKEHVIKCLKRIEGYKGYRIQLF